MTTNEVPSGDSSPPPVTPTPGSRSDGLARKVQLQAATPEAVLAAVPHLLGFYPSRSLVVLGLGQRGRIMVTFRYDLPEPADGELAADIAEHAENVLAREHIPSAMLIGYGPADLVEPVMTNVAARLVTAGIAVLEVLWAQAGRYRSMLCSDLECCPPDGRPYDPGSHPAAAAMTGAGLKAHPDREALARTLQRPAGSAARIARATRQAQLRLADLAAWAETGSGGDPGLWVARMSRREVQRAIRHYRAGRGIVRSDELTWLAVLLGDLRVRDDAWARMDPAHCEAHGKLWTDVVRAAGRDFVPAPASLLAFTAWQAGNGALAAMAIDRALAADPAYSMARLLCEAINAALPPAAARLPMSPADVAASYVLHGASGPMSRAPRPGMAPQGGAARPARSRSRRAGARRTVVR